MSRHPSIAVLLLTVVALATGCPGAGGNDVAGPENTVKLLMAGTGTGHVSINGGYLDCTASCGPYDWSPGMTVDLVATADSGSTFVSWSGDCATINGSTCSFVVNGHMVVTATFKAKDTVQVIMAGTGAGRVVSDGNTIDCPSNCGPLDWSPGLTVGLTAWPDVDSTFVNWSGDCTGTDPNVCTFVVNGNMKITATFNKF